MRGEKMKELMTGIEILSVETIDNSAFLIFLWNFFNVYNGSNTWICSFCFFGTRLWCCYCINITRYFGACCCNFRFVEASEAPRTYYKVTIDDSVSVNEFIKKYEIIQMNGKIYTIIEKDDAE